MSERLHLVVPGPITQRTGGYIYDRRIAEGLVERGWPVRVHELAGAFPEVDRTAHAAAAAVLDEAPPTAPLVIDGLALPAFADLTGRLHRWAALIHHPLAFETGLDPAAAAALDRIERRLLHHAPRVIVTSDQTRRDLAAFDVAADRIGVVLPGTDPCPVAAGAGSATIELLCVASVTPRKGHLTLIEALGTLRDLDWHLTCVGSLERDPQASRAVMAAIEHRALTDRIALPGELSGRDLAASYHRADLFVLASRHEGYGMSLAEALAHGLPIVATRAGAIPDTVGDAGLLVPLGDSAALAAALRQVIGDPAARQRLAHRALAARAALPTWDQAVDQFAAELRRALEAVA